MPPHGARRGPPLRRAAAEPPPWDAASAALWVLERLDRGRQGGAGRAAVVNLGAHDGTCSYGGKVVDPANCAFERGHPGIALEGKPGLLQKSSDHWDGVHLHEGYISPWNVSKIVRDSMEAHQATSISLLKIDLDHADCFFAQALLSDPALPLPDILVVEYNKAFPPPVRFQERFSDATVADFSGSEDSWLVFGKRRQWMGCSLQSWHDLVSDLGYSLLAADFEDLAFLRNGVLDLGGGSGELGKESGGGGAAGDWLFHVWLEAAHCAAPSRRLHGMQNSANLDLRALAEEGWEDRCHVAFSWWVHERGYLHSDMSCR
mmetsp:Transcript_131599/g.421156  ORF Transcript_131599/g.421156 Transcript_131599/m.421156 type:complete len:318 (-) Transcript_131599:61-1014(-)